MALRYEYEARNDIVLIERVEAGKIGNLVMPEVANEGWRNIVREIGPDVEHLQIGDEVHVIGAINLDIIGIPNETNVFATKQANVILIVRRKDAESEEE